MRLRYRVDRDVWYACERWECEAVPVEWVDNSSSRIHEMNIIHDQFVIIHSSNLSIPFWFVPYLPSSTDCMSFSLQAFVYASAMLKLPCLLPFFPTLKKTPNLYAVLAPMSRPELRKHQIPLPLPLLINMAIPPRSIVRSVFALQ